MSVGSEGWQVGGLRLVIDVEEMADFCDSCLFSRAWCGSLPDSGGLARDLPTGTLEIRSS